MFSKKLLLVIKLGDRGRVRGLKVWPKMTPLMLSTVQCWRITKPPATGKSLTTDHRLTNHRPPTPDPPTSAPLTHRPPTTDHRPTDQRVFHRPTDSPTGFPPTHRSPTHRLTTLLQLTYNPLTHQSYFNRVTIGPILSITNFNSSFGMRTIYY